MRTLALLIVTAVGLAAQTDRTVFPKDAPLTGRRLALVIGNQNYGRKPLQNPLHDAQDLDGELKSDLGFATTLLTDADLPTMERTINRFTGGIKPGDVALVYYSGHGMEVSGENYLLPVDFSAADEVDVKYKAYPASRLRDRLRAAGAGMTIIILDACRDNPFRSWKSEAGGGLAAMGGAGSFIAFAADEGKTADDNPGQRNGLFTKHLLAALREPGLSIDEVFNHVRAGVNRESGGRQTPFVYTGVIGTFRFREATAVVATNQPVIDLDMERYIAVKESRDPVQLEEAAGKMRREDLAEILRERARAMRSTAVTNSPTPALDKAQLTKDADAAFNRKDYATAFSAYQKLALADDAHGMVQFGYLYDKGYGTKQDYARAADWYRRAADAGQIYAMYNLGVLYEKGSGVNQDYSQAAIWYRKAADAGDPAGMRGIAILYDDGHGFKQDDLQALNWYRKSADAGDTIGMNNIGVMYETGQGVPKDLNQAASWYRKAAEGGYEKAKENLKRLGK